MIQVFATNYRSPALTTPPSGLIVFSLPKDVDEIRLVKIFFNQPIEGDAEFNLQLEGVNVFGSNLEIADGDSSVTSDPLAVSVSPEDKLSLDFPVMPDSFTYPINLEVYYDDGLGTAVYKEYVDTQDAATLASAQSYTDSHVVGLWDDRGSYDASTNAFPSSGGSGSAGAIKKGDIWTVSVAGTLGGHAVTAGDTVRALIDTPGSTDANWAIAENNIGYVPENQANKSTDGSLADNSDTDYPSEKAVKTYVDSAIALVGGGSSGTSQNGLVTGGQVDWDSDFIFNVSAAQYFINGTLYESPEDTVTLDAADATDDRIDLIVLTSSGTVDKVTGTPAAQPSKPDIDPATQLELTFVLVEASATAPTTADTENVYLENTEWTSSSSGSTWALASTNNPRTGTKCIEATSLSNNAYVQLQRATSTDLTDFNTLRIYARSKAAFGNNKFLRVQLFLNGVAVGNALTIAQNTISSFGFDTSVTSGYQLISIPISQFVIPAGSVINQIRITASGAGTGFYLDDIALVNTGTVIVSGTSGLTEEQADARYAQVTGAIFTGDVAVPADAYGAGWNGSNEVPTKNDVYDKVEAIVAGIPGSYTDEQAQDAVGTILVDTDDIDLVYTDGTPSIEANLKATAISAKSSATLDGTEEVLVNDGGLKKTTTQDIADLAASPLAQNTATVTTASLADGATEEGTVSLGKYAIISKVAADRACRVRLYIVADDRTDDATREAGTDVVDDDGNLLDERPVLEVNIGASPLIERLRPAVIAYNDDTVRASNLYYSIENTSGSTHTVQVIFTKLTLEA